jgi:hypothetical protein
MKITKYIAWRIKLQRKRKKSRTERLNWTKENESRLTVKINTFAMIREGTKPT